MKTLHIILKGDVQMVGFRYFVERHAKNIRGWVKNTPSGDVEILAQGEDKDVDDLLSKCKKGPWSAKVENVLVEEVPNELLSGFNIKL